MNKDINEELYRKILLLMALDQSYDYEFYSKYIPQETFDKLLKQAGVHEIDPDYIKKLLIQMMDELTGELQVEK